MGSLVDVATGGESGDALFEVALILGDIRGGGGTVVFSVEPEAVVVEEEIYDRRLRSGSSAGISSS